MSTALLLYALGTLPCLPEGLAYLDPPEAPFEVAATPAPAPAAASAPAPTPPPAAPGFAPAKLPRTGEITRYRVVYGLLGDLGEIEIFLGPADASRWLTQSQEKIRAVGSGSGSFLGLGKIEKRVEAELLPGKPSSRRWVSSRVQSGKTIVDTVEQPNPGEIAVLRRRTDRAEEGHRFIRQAEVLNPLAFLWRLRDRPPTKTEVFEVLDGRALWKIEVGPTRVVAANPTRKVLILKGKADPIFWDGQPDADRTARSFTLYLEGDAQHTPLRLVLPLGLGEVRVDLTSVSHPAPARAADAKPVGPPAATRTALVNPARR